MEKLLSSGKKILIHVENESNRNNVNNNDFRIYFASLNRALLSRVMVLSK